MDFICIRVLATGAITNSAFLTHLSLLEELGVQRNKRIPIDFLLLVTVLLDMDENKKIFAICFAGHMIRYTMCQILNCTYRPIMMNKVQKI